MRKALERGMLVGIFCASSLLKASYVDFKPTYSFESQQGDYIRAACVSSDIFLVEYTPPNQTVSSHVWLSPMVDVKPFPGCPTKKISNHIQTNNLRVSINKENSCSDFYESSSSHPVLELCPTHKEGQWQVKISTKYSSNIYGLGQKFFRAGTADGDLKGHLWDTGGPHGNSMLSFNRGAVGASQFPMAYFLGEGKEAIGLFVDNYHKQTWDFARSPWMLTSTSPDLRFFVIRGENIQEIRKNYMYLTGTPKVPPKSAFGLWVSRFGFENWDHLNSDLSHLRQNHFPVDGFVLDLQWFGGRFLHREEETQSKMGRLSFDTNKFPHPEQTINYLQNHQDVQLMLIEESYVSRHLEEFFDLEEKSYLADDCHSSKATILQDNPWWGIGGMIDWSNPLAGEYWHNTKRQKLIDMGIRFHWTDLGEPEMYDPHSCYFGQPEKREHQHKDIHNLFNLYWAQSIARGYKKNHVRDRHFILSRSGTSGIQRFGTAMWSGDIAGNMGSLTAHLNAQMHMSLVGLDYYGSDVAGFHRRGTSVDGDENELYTQWFANSSLFDVPIRPHTFSIAEYKETSPSKIGDMASNRYNLLVRYKLFPYYYSLAHQAFWQANPIIAPMVYYYPEIKELRNVGHQKMIGPYLMAGVVASYGEKERNIFFPSGMWYDLHDKKFIVGRNVYQGPFPTYSGNIFRLPLFLKEGGILPIKPHVQNMRNIIGKKNGKNFENEEHAFLIFPSPEKTSFDYYDDDGLTHAYQRGDYLRIQVNQQYDPTQKILHISLQKLRGLHNLENKPFRFQIISPYPIDSVKVDSIEPFSYSVEMRQTVF